MASAAFTINGSAVTELAVTAGSSVTLALVSASGVNVVSWSVVGSHDPSASNPTITPAGTPSGNTASFTMPSGYYQAYRIECEINGGVDENGVTQSAYTVTAVVGVNGIGGFMPFAAGETYERHATHGTTKEFNDRVSTNKAVVAAEGTLTTTDASSNTLATIATSQEYQYFVSAIVSSRQDSSANSAFQHIRFLYTNKGGTMAQQGSDDADALNYDAITMTGLASSDSSENILVTFAGKGSTTIRHEYLVEYVALKIATS